jgi:hypothetical protein
MSLMTIQLPKAASATRLHTPIPMSTENQDWQLLAQQASEEQDPERLMELVRQLNSALDNVNTRSSTPHPSCGEAA